MPREEEILNGSLPFPETHRADVIKLLPVSAGNTILDPLAGQGNTIVALAQAWGAEARAIENNAQRADVLVNQMGPLMALRADMYGVTLTPRSQDMIFLHSPYDRVNEGNTQREHLTHVLRWIRRPGGIIMMPIFSNHIDRAILQTLWRVSRRVDVFDVTTLPGWNGVTAGFNLHLVVAITGETPRYISEMQGDAAFTSYFKRWMFNYVNPTEERWEDEGEEDRPMIHIAARNIDVPDPSWTPGRYKIQYAVWPPTDPETEHFGAARLSEAMYEYVHAEGAPKLSEVEGPLYNWPDPISGQVLSFRPRDVPLEMINQVVAAVGVHTTEAFQQMVSPRKLEIRLRAPMAPNMRQGGAVVASGALGDAIRLPGNRLLRSRVRRTLKVVAHEEFDDEVTGELKLVRKTIQNQPDTTVTIMDADGNVEDVTGDTALANVVREYAPDLMEYLYENFPPVYLRENDPYYPEFMAMMENLRVRGIADAALTDEQKHVVAAMAKSLFERRGTILVGEPGVGKTIMTVALADVMRQMGASFLTLSKRQATKMSRKFNGSFLRPGEVVLGIVPPLVNNDEKWLGEFKKSIENIELVQIKDYADVDRLQALSNESRRAGDLVKQDVAAKREPNPTEIKLATRLIVGIVSESIIKDGEGWMHGVWWKNDYRIDPQYTLGHPERTYAEKVPVAPWRGDVVARTLADGNTKPMPEKFRSEPTGTPRGNPESWDGVLLNNQARGVGKTIGEWPDEIENAVNLQLRQQERFENELERSAVMRERLEAEPDMIRRHLELLQTGRTHVWFRPEIGGIPQRPQIARVPGSQWYQRAGWNGFRSHIEDAMYKVRALRIANERNPGIAEPLWQQRRNYSSIKRQTGYDPRDLVKARREPAAPETNVWAACVWWRYITTEKWQARRAETTMLPLPDVCQQLLRPEEYLIDQVADWKQGRPIPLVDYMVKRLGKCTGLFFADELHQYKDMDAKRAVAMTKLANMGRKIIGLTGTIYGGRASTLFLLLFLFNEEVRKVYQNPSSSVTMTQWARDMGVTQYVEEHDLKKNKITNKPEQEVPGAAPTLLRVLLNTAIFVSLRALRTERIPFFQLPVEIEMDDIERELYVAAERELREYYDGLPKGKIRNGAASMMYQALVSLTSAWWRERPVYHRQTLSWAAWEELKQDEIRLRTPEPKRWEVDPDAGLQSSARKSTVKVRRLVTKIPSLGWGRMSSKERWLQRLVTDQVNNGARGVGIYVEHTDEYDIQQRFTNSDGNGILDGIEGVRPFILRASVAPEKRAAHIAKKVAEGYNVFIAQSRLVQVGMDLLDFPTLVWFEPNNSLYTMIQASARANRMNSRRMSAVYYPYAVKFMDPELHFRFLPTMEEAAVGLIAQKQAAAAFLYGESTAGLSALAEGARSIGDEVMEALENIEDISQRLNVRAAFDIVNSEEEADQTPPTYMEGIVSQHQMRARQPREAARDDGLWGEGEFDLDNMGDFEGWSIEELNQYIFDPDAPMDGDVTVTADGRRMVGDMEVPAIEPDHMERMAQDADDMLNEIEEFFGGAVTMTPDGIRIDANPDLTGDNDDEDWRIGDDDGWDDDDDDVEDDDPFDELFDEGEGEDEVAVGIPEVTTASDAALWDFLAEVRGRQMDIPALRAYFAWYKRVLLIIHDWNLNQINLPEQAVFNAFTGGITSERFAELLRENMARPQPLPEPETDFDDWLSDVNDKLHELYGADVADVDGGDFYEWATTAHRNHRSALDFAHAIATRNNFELVNNPVNAVEVVEEEPVAVPDAFADAIAGLNMVALGVEEENADDFLLDDEVEMSAEPAPEAVEMRMDMMRWLSLMDQAMMTRYGMEQGEKSTEAQDEAEAGWEAGRTPEEYADLVAERYGWTRLDDLNQELADRAAWFNMFASILLDDYGVSWKDNASEALEASVGALYAMGSDERVTAEHFARHMGYIEDEPVLERAELDADVAAIEAAVNQPEVEEVEFNFVQLWDQWLASIPVSRRAAVNAFMRVTGDYMGFNVSRRRMVERMALGLRNYERLPEPIVLGQLRLAWQIGDIAASDSEVLYLKFIYSTLEEGRAYSTGHENWTDAQLFMLAV